MLPDCFGFPASLPTILAHAGVKGFSTQKLVWGSSAPGGGPESIEPTPEGTPFNVGVWVGPDGESVLAGLNPGDAQGKNVPCRYSYVFAYARDLPAGARTIRLPQNHEIRILAMSVAKENPAIRALRPLYDGLPAEEK
jgi:Glycosyl hydrolases family 38 N-terminal domain